ncbi:MAG: class IV adenylate cyclase [Planctomycetota bacterium]
MPASNQPNQGWEVEQKYFLSDAAEFLTRLQDAGFQASSEEQHCDLYFRHPCRDFRATDEAFRLRRVNDELCVTYKGKRLEAEVKTRPEIELGLVAQDFEQWKTMIGHLGFEALPEVSKRRQNFIATPGVSEFDGFVVTLDEVRELGTFAEIELLVESETELPEAQKRIESLAKTLSLHEVQKLSYLAQLLKKLGFE